MPSRSIDFLVLLLVCIQERRLCVASSAPRHRWTPVRRVGFFRLQRLQRLAGFRPRRCGGLCAMAISLQCLPSAHCEGLSNDRKVQLIAGGLSTYASLLAPVGTLHQAATCGRPSGRSIIGDTLAPEAYAQPATPGAWLSFSRSLRCRSCLPRSILGFNVVPESLTEFVTSISYHGLHLAENFVKRCQGV